jgi:hypothetical protein
VIDLKTVKFGTDAEVFCRTLTGHPFPVCGLFGGTKDEPKPLPFGEGFAVQEDNAAAEFNVPATPYIKDMASNIHATLQHLSAKLPESLQFDMEHCSLVFSEEYLKIPQMQVFGCDPDFNAYTETANERPNPQQPGFRTAAAHIHVSWENPEDEDRLEMVRLSDVFAVLPTIKSQGPDEARRRTLYGKAGAFRPKPYGGEHRVLSNGWIRSRESIQKTFQCYADALAALNAGVRVEVMDYANIQMAINKPHKKLAEALYKKYMKKLMDVMGKNWSQYEYYNTYFVRARDRFSSFVDEAPIPAVGNQF